MPKRLIDDEAIYAFVKKVEDTKGFKEDPVWILRHLVSELGELERALWIYEKALAGGTTYRHDFVVRECVDIVCLAVYMAHAVGGSVEGFFKERMDEIRKQYGVTA
jgi:NTP pyrophosphatase (non-canonical NTP hydrolase)